MMGMLWSVVPVAIDTHRGATCRDGAGCITQLFNSLLYVLRAVLFL